MSEAGFERFRRRVLDDPELQRQLAATTELDAFSALVISLAADGGEAVTREDIDRAIQHERRARLERWL